MTRFTKFRNVKLDSIMFRDTNVIKLKKNKVVNISE